MDAKPGESRSEVAARPQSQTSLTNTNFPCSCPELVCDCDWWNQPKDRPIHLLQERPTLLASSRLLH